MCDLVLEQLLLDIVLEVLNHAILPHDLVLHLIGCLGQTFLSHSQIVHDQNQVLIDSIEVFLLRAHLICLFVKFLDLDLLRANVTLQLLDLVVENELKLFQLLNLLLKLPNLDILLIDRGNPRLVLLLARMDVLLDFLLLHQFVLKLVLLLLQILRFVTALHVL